MKKCYAWNEEARECDYGGNLEGFLVSPLPQVMAEINKVKVSTHVGYIKIAEEDLERILKKHFP